MGAPLIVIIHLPSLVLYLLQNLGWAMRLTVGLRAGSHSEAVSQI